MQSDNVGAEIRSLGSSDFQAYYKRLEPKIGNYDQIWGILQRRARKTGWFPEKLHRLLGRFFKRSHPYFIGTTSDGIRFLGDYRDYYSVRWAVFPDFDSPAVEFIRAQASSHSNSYADVGANMGITVATLARGVRDLRPIYAFEPTEETALRAAATFALNDLANVQLFQIAIGDQNTKIQFFVPEGFSETASAIKISQRGEVAWQQTEVECRTLDSLRDDGILETIGFLKVDVEGYEPQVIRGAHGLLQRDRPTVFYEYNPQMANRIGWNLSDINATFEQVGGYHFQVWHDRLIEFPPPNNNQLVNIYCTSK